MEGSIAIVGAIVAVIGAITSALIGFWTVSQTKTAQQVAAYRAVHDLYDKMVQLKFDNPGFLVLARDWNASKMKCVFNPRDPMHVQWSLYYTFSELCIGFANSVLQAHAADLMGDDEFRYQWERLVRLVVAEHYPIISEFIEEGPYVSEYLRNYIQLRASEGWDWQVEHTKLVW